MLIQYVCLSHCWTQDDFELQLLSSNLAQLEHCIEQSQFNAMVNDAIWITVSLGYTYLWVDTLCIIHDPENGQEIAHMNQIYGNAVCPLAAEVDNGRIIIGREPRFMFPCSLETYGLPGTYSHTLRLRGVLGRYSDGFLGCNCSRWNADANHEDLSAVIPSLRFGGEIAALDISFVYLLPILLLQNGETLPNSSSSSLGLGVVRCAGLLLKELYAASSRMSERKFQRLGRFAFYQGVSCDKCAKINCSTKTYTPVINLE